MEASMSKRIYYVPSRAESAWLPSWLIPNAIVRVSPALSNAKLAGRVVVFRGFLALPSIECVPAVVQVVEKDGSWGEEWLVIPYFLQRC